MAMGFCIRRKSRPGPENTTLASATGDPGLTTNVVRLTPNPGRLAGKLLPPASLTVTDWFLLWTRKRQIPTPRRFTDLVEMAIHLGHSSAPVIEFVAGNQRDDARTPIAEDMASTEPRRLEKRMENDVCKIRTGYEWPDGKPFPLTPEEA